MLLVWKNPPASTASSTYLMIAFAFHRTAYKERLEDVKCGLRVIEKLREYKPRARQHGSRPSGGHGVFNRSFAYPFSEKDTTHRQCDDSISQGCDTGNDADTEDNRGKGKQKQASSHPHDVTPDSLELEDLTRPTSHSPFDPSHENQDTFHENPPPRKHAAEQHTNRQEEYNPAIQAARVIKSAVLHDARNIKGSDKDLSGLLFSVNTTYEAKV